jgi:hypothetical protein
MSIRKIAAFVAIGLFYTNGSFAGCLEPQKPLLEGRFSIESCSFNTVTHAQFDDPRLGSGIGSNTYKNPVDVLAVEKKKGKQRIFSLSLKDQGVLLSGKIVGQDRGVKAFLRSQDTKFCEKLVKSNVIDVSISEMCCDCLNSCTETPCSLGTKNEVTKYKMNP